MSDKNIDFIKFSAHFPSEISAEIHDYVTNDVLLGSRYIFTKRVAGVQFGYCTHCRNSFQSGSLKHNGSSVCPKCESKCKVKASGISRKYLRDSSYFVYYEKSLINPNAIIARGFRVSRDYSGKYTDIETNFVPLAMYLFELGSPQMWENYYWNKNDWRKRDSCMSLYSTSIYASNQCSDESIQQAIKGTQFQYSTWNEHSQPQYDYVRFFELYSKYPCVEYLTKMGLSCFVNAKLFYKKTYGAIDWNAKSIDKVLRLNKQQMRELREGARHIEPHILRLYQISRKDSNPPTLREIYDIFDMLGNCMSKLQPILKYVSVKKVIAYIKKQLGRKDKQKYESRSDVLTAWRDYLNECKKLQIDLNDERVVLPSNLFSSHQKTMQLVTHQQNATLDSKISARMKVLNKYVYENDEFVIRPAASTWELINEGKILKICVGGYAERYAKGNTTILLIRKKNKPDTPYFTLEIRENRIQQVQGLSHCYPTGSVKNFIDQFKNERLENKAQKLKVKEAVAV